LSVLSAPCTRLPRSRRTMLAGIEGHGSAGGCRAVYT
jgi:hypothetical protein